MRESRLSHLVDPLRETMHNRAMLMERARSEQGLRFAGLFCDILPPEIFAACGVVPLLISGSAGPDYGNGFEFFISDSSDSSDAGKNALSFHPPAGWADYAAIELRKRLDKLLSEMRLPSLTDIDETELRKQAVIYNSLRRTVRGIHAARKRNPLILSNADLFALYEAAAGVPAEKALDLLSSLSLHVEKEEDSEISFAASALVTGGRPGDISLLDEIEEKGVLAAEDHFCCGRRMFDLSYNPEAPDIVSEIVYAFTFKIYCHSIRKVDERYELFYKMLKPHGIECAFFIDTQGEHRPDPGDFDILRKRLMRGGVDPVLCDESNAAEAAARYAESAEVLLGV